jgi:coenzyme F420 hydrogenase subunit beta
MVVKKGRYVPQWEKHRCNHCDLCREACPGHGIDFEKFKDALFAGIPEDITLGRYLGCYVGHAMDKNVRYHSTSGGLVSSLLVFALEQGLIDAALVTRMRRDDPLKPEPFLARTREEILSAARSKYCPVATNAALQEILESDDRIAVVGLPCQIQGIRKAEQRIPRLARQIRYRLSLACSLNFSFRGTERFLHHLGLAPERVAAFEYRSRGRPGSVRIRMKDGTEWTIPYAECYRQLAPYSLQRCTLCHDSLGELSDLTCGNAWIVNPQYDLPRLGTRPAIAQTDSAGSTFAVSRTSEAEELLEWAASDGAVELSELDVRDLLASRNHALFKKRELSARRSLSKRAGQSVAPDSQKLPPSARADYLHSLRFFAARHVLSGCYSILRLFFRGARRQKHLAPESCGVPAEAANLRGSGEARNPRQMPNPKLQGPKRCRRLGPFRISSSGPSRLSRI